MSLSAREVYLESIVGQAIHQFELDTGIKVEKITVIRQPNRTFKLLFIFDDTNKIVKVAKL